MGQGSASGGKVVLQGKTEQPFAQPFTPRFGLFSWDYWTFGSVYPTFWPDFVGLWFYRQCPVFHIQYMCFTTTSLHKILCHIAGTGYYE